MSAAQGPNAMNRNDHRAAQLILQLGSFRNFADDVRPVPSGSLWLSGLTRLTGSSVARRIVARTARERARLSGIYVGSGKYDLCTASTPFGRRLGVISAATLLLKNRVTSFRLQPSNNLILIVKVCHHRRRVFDDRHGEFSCCLRRNRSTGSPLRDSGV